MALLLFVRCLFDLFIRDAGMDVVSLVRGGFFPGQTAKERQKAIESWEKRVWVDLPELK